MALWFLRIEGITGDSSVTGHEGSIRVASWSWSVSNKQGMATGAGSGHAVLHDLVVTAASGRSLLQLIQTCAARPSRHGQSHRRPRRQRALHLPALRPARVSIETVTQTVEDSGDVLDQAVLQFRGLTGTFWRQLPDGSAGPPLSIEIGNPPH